MVGISSRVTAFAPTMATNYLRSRSTLVRVEKLKTAGFKDFEYIYVHATARRDRISRDLALLYVSVLTFLHRLARFRPMCLWVSLVASVNQANSADYLIEKPWAPNS